MSAPIRAIDLCCGAGGWACAARGLPIEWVAVADREADCLETWRVNHLAAHPECRTILCDLSTAEGIGSVMDACLGRRIDLVVGGIPCEQVSAARRNRPASAQVLEPWHELIDRCLGVVRDLAPRWWAIEDVRAIERHLPTELELGIPIPVRRIRAERYGPQARERTFLGHFPPPAAPEDGPRTLAQVLRPGPYRTLQAAGEGLRRSKRQYYTAGTCRVWDQDRPGHTVLDWGGGHCRGALIELPDGRLRILEWAEAAALQGFPEDYLLACVWSRAWKMVAQAIPIYVGRAILQSIAAEHVIRERAPMGEGRVRA